MDSSRVAEIVSAAIAILGTIANIIQIYDWFQTKKRAATLGFPKSLFGISSMAICTIVSIIFFCWVLFANPFRATVVEKTVYVDKPMAIPCPATKTGPATARAGGGGPAIGHSGNGDTIDLNTHPKPPNK